MAVRLILFTRFPMPGTTKTRLIPALGPDGAAQLQREMTEHILARLLPLRDAGVEIEVRYEGGSEAELFSWLGRDLLLTKQGDGDLGQRMERAFREAFAAGAGKVVLVGSDCPDLGAGDVAQAASLLDDNHVCLGPAVDGGYYLVALRPDTPEDLFRALFADIPWGTSEVMWRTSTALAEAGFDQGLLDEKADVDEPEDLTVWERVKSGTQTQTQSQAGHIFPFWGARSGEKTLFGGGTRALFPESESVSETLEISVIIPTVNEEEHIGDLLDDLAAEEVEIVVADGGSTDRTLAICREKGVKVVSSPAGRAVQMNAGAAAARGNVLLFLHADTKLPQGWAGQVRGAVRRGAVGGAFLFGADVGGSSMNVIENAAHFRSIRLGVVFGDQAIFAGRGAFDAVGGFPVQPVMEDYEFWKRLGREGRREIVQRQVTTSARKWVEGGLWRTTLVNQLVTWLYVLGMGPERLAGVYRKLMKGP